MACYDLTAPTTRIAYGPGGNKIGADDLWTWTYEALHTSCELCSVEKVPDAPQLGNTESRREDPETPYSQNISMHWSATDYKHTLLYTPC